MAEEEEEEKVLQSREWANLKLIGQPLLSGRAPWVALRPLPRLVHVYFNSDLQALLRFPKDPSFLLLRPCQINRSDLKHLKGCTSESTCASLVVITSDGSLWYIQQIPSHDSVHRPIKKSKQSHAKQETDDVWDIFEDCDIYKDTDLYPDQEVLAHSKLAPTDLSKPHLLYRALSLKTLETASRRARVENVQPKAFIGKFPDACLAAAGPNNLIAVASSSRSPIILNEASLSTDFAMVSTIGCHLNKGTRPSCLLFATTKDSEQNPPLEGLNLSPNFFNALARGFTPARPKLLLLQGNTSGEVHIFCVDDANHITFPPLVLCDLKEPILKLSALSLHKVSDALLVTSSCGYFVVINVSKSEYERASIFSSITEPSLQRLFRLDLRDAFSLYSWRVKGPVVSLTVHNSGRLCLHIGSRLYLLNLLKTFSSDPTHKSKHPWLTRETSIEVSMKKSLVCKTVPLFDIVVAIVEGGPMVPETNTVSLMALTSRGRLVAVQISSSILKAQNECFISTDHDKTWKRMNRNGDMMVLLDEIAAVGSCTKDLEAMKTAIDHALSELAIALKVAHDITGNRIRDSLLVPCQSLPMPLIASVHCNLEVKPVIPILDSRKLCFTPDRNNQTQKVHPCFTENALIVRLDLKVTLANHGPYPVSPYWILLLDVHPLEERKTMFFSRVINDGCGLAPHTSSALEFQIPADYSTTPLEVDIFLCHFHDYHDEVLQTLAFPDFSHYGVHREQFERNAAKFLLEPENSTVHAKSKAACLLLSRYQVDILSLLKPPHRVNSVFDILPIQPQLVQVDGEREGTLGLRSVIGKFQLRLARIKDPGSRPLLASEERWKENGLEDVVKCCPLSKDGGELSAVDVHGNPVLLALGNQQLGGEDLPVTEIRFSTSCPLTGFMVREAVLGRLKQQIKDWRMLEADIMGPFQNMDEVLNMVVDIEGVDLLEQDVENTVNLWHEGQLEHSEVGGRVYRTFERAAELYRSYREADASNPFWGLVGRA